MKLKARIIDKTAMKIIVMQNKMHHCTENTKSGSNPTIHTHKIQEAEEVNYDWDYKRGFKENIFELDLEE